MTKLEMAHELLITLIQAGEHNNCSDTAVKYVWRVIDAMQAEADKRNDTERPAVLNMADSPQLEYPQYDPTLEYPYDAKVTFHGKVVSIQDIEGSRFWF